MSAWTAYGLGVATPILALIVIGTWMWLTEEAGRWWRDQQPTLARVRCALTGHRYWSDNGWVICQRCSHAKRRPGDRSEPLRTLR